jgi:hypothetical protein
MPFAIKIKGDPYLNHYSFYDPQDTRPGTRKQLQTIIEIRDLARFEL